VSLLPPRSLLTWSSLSSSLHLLFLPQSGQITITLCPSNPLPHINVMILTREIMLLPESPRVSEVFRKIMEDSRRIM
ncbi:hypothetical protein LINPERHAP1_LOCUS37645, partial [Linum perenne]